MKRTLTGFIAFASLMSLNAQVGVRAGLNFSNLTFENIQTDDYKMSMLGDKKAGFHVGLVGRVSLFSLYLQPELLFNTATNTFELEDLVANETHIIEQKFNKLSIPVVIGKSFGPLRAGVGPVATILISDKSELAAVAGYKEKFNTATFGYQFDLGLDIGDIALDVKWEGNLSKFGDGIEIGGQTREFDSREKQLIVSVGYFF